MCTRFHVAVLALYAAVLAESLPFPTIPIIRSVLPPGQHCCPVNEKLLWSKTLRGFDASATSLLEPLFSSYRFLLPELQLRDGLEHLGTAVRLRSFVSDFMTGARPLKVGVMGGSISWGEGATSRGVTDWFSMFLSWLASVSTAGVSGRNGCVPATTSTYAVLCLEQSVDPDVDLVLVEYTVNDGFADGLLGNPVLLSKERLVRRLLGLPGRPAVVLVHLPHLKHTSLYPFPITTEDLEGALASYYDVPSISLRNALFPLNVHDPTPGFLWNQTFVNHHPGDAGHRALADLAVHLVQQVAVGLVRHPHPQPRPPQRETPDGGGGPEAAQRAEPLPPPMYTGNLPPEQPSCLVGPALTGLVVANDGWSWVNEGSEAKPKWGFVADRPGAALTLRIDTTDPRAAPGGPRPAWSVPVLVHHLKSYSAMGSAVIRCVNGCTCQDQAVEGWHEEHVSQTSMAYVRTHRLDNATACELTVMVRNETSTGGHKFKVSGVVVAVGYDLSGRVDFKYWHIPDDA